MSVRLGSVIWLAAFAALASACAPVSPPPYPGETRQGLNGTTWVLESASNAPAAAQPAPAAAAGTVTPAAAPAPLSAAWLLPDRGTRPTLTFSADRAAVSGATGCNRYFGSYSASTTQVWLSNLATTKMMCFDALAVQEIQYLDMLARVQGYSNNGASLTLTTNDGRHLVFSPLSVQVGMQAAVYHYVCEDGLYFNASYDPATQSAAISISTGDSDTLQHTADGRTGSYASARHRLQATGSDALLETLDDGMSHHCVAPLAPKT